MPFSLVSHANTGAHLIENFGCTNSGYEIISVQIIMNTIE